MHEEMMEFIGEERTAVLAVEMLDGSPHAATLHFVHAENPLKIIFLTDRTYRKAEPILQKGTTRASVVIGTEEACMKTLQLDGTISLTNAEQYIEAYYTKFIDKDRAKLNEQDIFLEFTPVWSRYTDWTKPEGKTTFDSQGNIQVFPRS